MRRILICGCRRNFCATGTKPSPKKNTVKFAAELLRRPAKNGRVLLIEGDGPTLDRLAEDLASYGIHAQTARSAEEAMGLTADTSFDVAVVDSRFLEEHMAAGSNLILALREKTKPMRFVLMLDELSPHNKSFEEAMRGLMNPIMIDETLSKPCTASRLVQAILSAL